MAYQEYSPRSTLFQFTNLEGFKGILSSRSLWFTNLSTLNDPRELTFGLARVRPLLEEIVSANRDFEPSLIRPVLEHCYRFVRVTELYSCSFCPSGDLMPMWQQYGADGTGIAVGFRPSAITSMPVRIQKVDYVNKETPIEDLREVLSEVLRPFSRYSVAPTLEQRLALASTVAAKCTSMKHSSWEHEREVRAVYSQTAQKEEGGWLGNVTSLHLDGTPHKWTEPHKRAGTDREGKTVDVSYIPFPFGKGSGEQKDYSKAIERVVIGPKSTATIGEVEDILYSEGFSSFSVEVSDCQWI